MTMKKKIFFRFSIITLSCMAVFLPFPQFSGASEVEESPVFVNTIETSSQSPDRKIKEFPLSQIKTPPEILENRSKNPPIAAAGPDQLVDEKAKVFLDASNSWPLDISTAMVFWKQLEGPLIQLSNPEEVRPHFIAPAVGPEGAALVFELTLATDEGFTVSDTCIVNVSWGNIQPSADAGDNQNASQGNKIFLDGSGSWDADGKREDLKYEWRQTEGPRVVLSDPSAIKPSFVAPFTLNPVETLTFELITTDKGGLKGSDKTIVNITAENSVLVADAGPDSVYDEGRPITLDGSNSISQPGAIARCFWTQLQGPPVTLSDPTSIKPTFLSPPVKNFETVNLIFDLTITSESGLKASKKTRIRLDDNWFSPYSQQAIIFPLEDLAIGFEVEKGGQIVNLSHLKTAPLAAGQPPETPYGLFDVQIRTYEPGGEVELKVYLPQPAPPDYHWLKCGNKTGWSNVPIQTLFNAERTVFTFRIKDGGPCDEDGIADGMIMDPSGLGGPIVTSSNISGGSSSPNIHGMLSKSAAGNQSVENADLTLAKLVKLIFGGIGGLQTDGNQTHPEAKALTASNVGWSWLSLQFGPAFPILFFSFLGFISFVLLKKTLRALISGKDQQ